jgi:hypothetical protein
VGDALAERLEFHRRRAEPILASLGVPFWTDSFSGSRDELVSIVVTLASWGGGGLTYADRVLRRKLPYTLEDARLLHRFAEDAAREGGDLTIIRAFLAAADVVGPEGLEPELERSFALVDAAAAYASERNGARARLVKLTGRGTANVALGEDDWAPRVRPLIDGPRAEALVAHLATATQSKPSARWLAALAPLQDEELVRGLLEAAAEADTHVVNEFEYDGRVYQGLAVLTEANAVIVKGAAWAAGALDAAWAPRLLERVFRRIAPDHAAVANACVNVLGGLSDQEAVLVLSRLAGAVKDRGYRKLIDRALGAAAARTGLSPSQLVERVVPDFGLDGEGRTELPLGGWSARIEVDHARVRVRWTTPAGKEQAAAPKDVDTTGAKAEIRELRKELGVQRARLERMLSEGPRWALDDWRVHYLGHPLVGVLARRLLWRFDGEPRLGTDAPRSAEAVELWHPIGAGENEVYELRRDLIEREVLQPFKQAFREVYRLTAKEREAALYSNRFAGHVLDFPQTYALLKERGWRAQALGAWDGGYEGEVAREFPAQGLRAGWSLAYLEDAGMAGSIGALATTDQVRFYALAARTAPPLPLADVPLVVFSEAMRDIGLFVGVASIAADPDWEDRGLEGWQDYWWREAFAELGPAGELRRQVLAGLLPRLAIADRLELEDRWLVVRGDLRTYRIHLGSAHVLMEPDDELLSVGASERPTTKVFLPFEDDARLNVILAKAFLLARDSKIGDRSIRQQIERGS